MRSRIRLTLWVGFVMSLLLSSCSDTEKGVSDTGTSHVVITAGIKTRAIDASWHQGDCIGLISFKTDGGDPIAHHHNCRYTTHAGDGNFHADEDNTIYFPLDGSEIDLIGYYPHCADIGNDYIYKVNVSAQDDRPAIDLMTFDRYSGASKNNPNVNVVFKHRLSKLIFNFRLEDRSENLKIKNLVISGMRTEGSFNLLTNELLNHADTQKDLVVPVEALSAAAIVLPRAAGEGILFTVTLENDTEYEVQLHSEQELKAGYKYTFNVLLRDKETPAVISAIVQDWETGNNVEIDTRPIIIEQAPGESVGFQSGDVLTLYCENDEVGEFLFDGQQWDSTNPLYWENVGDGCSEEVTLRAGYTRADALDDTQLPEIMLAEVVCKRFEGIKIPFRLVPAKLVFILKSESTDNKQTFTPEELSSAKIELPEFISEYSVTNGIFASGTQKGTIKVVENTALVIPQEKGGILAKITIDGKEYVAPLGSNMVFDGGMLYTLTINVLKTQATSITASYTEWVADGTDHNLTALVIAGGGGVTSNFKEDEKLSLYYGNISATKVKVSEFAYEGNNYWSSSPLAYWENLDDLTSYNFYATSILSGAPANSNQMDDVMYAETYGLNIFATIDLAFTKMTSRVLVVLQSNDFTNDELATAVITLPDYKIGGAYSGIEFVSGSDRGVITTTATAVAHTWSALVEPQTISAGSTVVNVKIGENNYQVSKTVDTLFDVAKTHTLKVTVSKTGIDISTSYSDWEPGDEENVNVVLD